MLQQRSKGSLPVLSSRILMLSCLTFRSFIHFKFSFVYHVGKLSSFILLHVTVQFSEHHLLKKLFPPPTPHPHWIFFPAFWKIIWPYICQSISGFSFLFHWSMCLFLHYYHSVLKTTTFRYSLMSEIMILKLFFFFFLFQNCFGYSEFLCFNANFRNVWYSSVKNARKGLH